MAVNILSNDHASDDDYIDMELTSFSNFFSNSITTSSPSHPLEFEFQMSSVSLDNGTTTSPADELFYKGKLLPLHLPPRLQMVEKLLQTSNSSSSYERMDFNSQEFYSTPLMITAATTPTAMSTPFESCNVSPSGSCHVSGELHPDVYFFEYSSESNGFASFENCQKRSWTKKLKIVKRSSSLGSKLKASGAYLRSLFGKSGCSDDTCAAAAKVADEGMVSKAKESCYRYPKRRPFGQIQKVNQRKTIADGSVHRDQLHRRSFSTAIKRHSTNKSPPPSSLSGSSLSSNSSNSKGFHGLPFLKRSSSARSEIENPIQGAIAHCKQSQQVFRPIKNVSEVGLYSLSASRFAHCKDQERANLCRG